MKFRPLLPSKDVRLFWVCCALIALLLAVSLGVSRFKTYSNKVGEPPQKSVVVLTQNSETLTDTTVTFPIGQSPEFAELRAQKMTAHWTRVMGVVATFATLLSSVALVVSCFGVYYLRKTLQINQDVVRLMSAQSDVAKEQSAISMAQIRAYLETTKLRMCFSNRCLDLEVCLKNYGNSPAQHVEVKIEKFRIYEADYEDEQTVFAQHQFSGLDLAFSNQTIPHGSQRDFFTMLFPEQTEKSYFTSIFHNRDCVRIGVKLIVTFYDVFQSKQMLELERSFEMCQSDRDNLDDYSKTFELTSESSRL